MGLLAIMVWKLAGVSQEVFGVMHDALIFGLTYGPRVCTTDILPAEPFLQPLFPLLFIYHLFLRGTHRSPRG